MYVIFRTIPVVTAYVPSRAGTGLRMNSENEL